MYVRSHVRFRVVWSFAWKYVLFYAAYSGAITWAYDSGFTELAIPFQPLSLLGIATAFYVGFKNSQAYDRYWEARKTWGSIVNTSRSFAANILTFTPGHTATPSAEARTIIRRHVAWVNVLRHHLRRESDFSDTHAFLPPADVERLPGWRNKATQLLLAQARDLQALRDSGAVDSFHHVALSESIRDLYDFQGRCERIKTTPFPRQYAYFSQVFTWLFILVLPLGLVQLFHGSAWKVVPCHVLVAWVFMTMELVGHYSENPFENSFNDVAMTAICRAVEIDLLQMLGETQLPDAVQPVNDVLL